MIAGEVHDVILRRGGRFLQETGVTAYEVVGEKVSMEKCKQALREKQASKDEAKKTEKKKKKTLKKRKVISPRKSRSSTDERIANVPNNIGVLDTASLGEPQELFGIFDADEEESEQELTHIAFAGELLRDDLEGIYVPPLAKDNVPEMQSQDEEVTFTSPPTITSLKRSPSTLRDDSLGDLFEGVRFMPVANLSHNDSLACLSPFPAVFPASRRDPSTRGLLVDFEDTHLEEGGLPPSDKGPCTSLLNMSSVQPSTLLESERPLDTHLGVFQVDRPVGYQQPVVFNPLQQSPLLLGRSSKTTMSLLESIQMLRRFADTSISSYVLHPAVNNGLNLLPDYPSPLNIPSGDHGRHQRDIGHLHREEDCGVRDTFVSTMDDTKIGTGEVTQQGKTLNLGDDTDLTESFLSAIGFGADVPRFSQQDEIREEVMLTEEERASILIDMFGDKCSIRSHQSKRPKRDADYESVSYHVKLMRNEIDKMPSRKKRALTEAQAKCRPEEFSDSRLSKFLRVEGMNAEVSCDEMRLIVPPQ